MFAVGDEVEVKVGGSLGRWVPGVVAGVCGYGRAAAFTVKGFGEENFGASRLRRPRGKVVAATSSAARPRKPRARKDVVEIGRGPLRFPEFRKWVKTRPCIFCHMKADDPHHYGPKGTGQTTDDTRLTPVCRTAHDALHAHRVDELCAPAAYLRDSPAHDWAIVEAHIFRAQVNLVTEFLRFHNGEMR